MFNAGVGVQKTIRKVNRVKLCVGVPTNNKKNNKGFKLILLSRVAQLSIDHKHSKKNTVMHRNCCFTCIVEPIGVEESTSSEDNLCGTVAADGGAIDFTQHLRKKKFQSRGRLVKSPDINNK